MKNIRLNCSRILLPIVLLLSTEKTMAQQQDFYYLLENKTATLTTVPGKYLIGFTGAEPQSAPGSRIGPKQYIVSDTNGFATWPHYITPTFGDPSGDEMNYGNELVLMFKDNTSSGQKASLMATYNLTFVGASTSYELYRSEGDALQTSKAVYESGLVNYCHPDFMGKVHHYGHIPGDEMFKYQWYLHNIGGTINGKSMTADADIDAPEAWDFTRGDSTLIVAVLDEGVTSDHIDLPNTRQVRVPGSNLVSGLDGSFNPNDPSPTDSALITRNFNHGNSCAGIIAAKMDSGNHGGVGIAPKCRIMPIKLAFDPVVVPSSQFAAAIDLAVLNGAKVINMSWGWIPSKPSIPVQLAIDNAIKSNRIVVIAAGNTADRRYSPGSTGYIQYPACINIEDVLTVAASDRNNKVANYSPNGSDMELVAPSHTAYPYQIPGEAGNIYTLDIPGLDKGANNWRDTTGGYPLVGEQLPGSGTGGVYNNTYYTGRFGGTSAAAPQVAGVAALMVSVFPKIPVGTVRDFLQSSCDKIGGYDYGWMDAIFRPTKWPGYCKELGYGKLNAYKAVRAAKEAYLVDKDSSDILYIKDNTTDVGITKLPEETGGGDRSPDIWCRNGLTGDTNAIHQPPIYTGPGSSTVVYVRVHNKSSRNFRTFSTYAPRVTLYWSIASSWSGWPRHWDGSKPDTGGKIGDMNLPNIDAGKSAIVKIGWLLPPSLATNPNVCLLAVIDYVPRDTIINYPNRLDQFINRNNNVAAHNITVVKEAAPPLRASVLVGNALQVPTAFNIKFGVPVTSPADITEEAEVRLSFDPLGWGIVEQAFLQQQDGVSILPNREVILSKKDVVLSNITFPADTRIQVGVQFNFLSDKQTEATRFDYTISQAFADTPDMVLGTENYDIHKTVRTPFNAYAGEDTTINKGSSTTLTALDIQENADYNWYDEQHNLLGTGLQYTVSPTVNKTYILEVISLVDGFKDYDQVNVNVRQHFITSMSPNPATTQVSVGYDAATAATASLNVLLPNGSVHSTYTLNPAMNTTNINTSQFTPGIYNVVLVCNGQAVDARTLQVN